MTVVGGGSLHATFNRMPTVLVIDTDAELIHTMSNLLEDHGMHVVPALLYDIQHGRVDFIDLISKHRPDAVIVDVPPPYIQNWNFARMLRCIDVLANIPTIYITTNKRALDRAVGETDAVIILDKPFGLDAILQALDLALCLRKATSP